MGVRLLRSFSHEHPLIVFGKIERSISIDSHHPIECSNPEMPNSQKILRIGKNGVKEDLMVSSSVNKF